MSLPASPRQEGRSDEISLSELAFAMGFEIMQFDTQEISETSLS
jgi:hypothetical protein